MIQYTGRGDECKITLILAGDGRATSTTVDVTKAPFNLKLVAAPVRVAAFTDAPAAPPVLESVELVNGKLMVKFETPLPETNFDYASGHVGAPRTNLELYFLYEMA